MPSRVSGTHYGKRGELGHLNFAESDFNYTGSLRTLRGQAVGGMVICEIPNPEEAATAVDLP